MDVFDSSLVATVKQAEELHGHLSKHLSPEEFDGLFVDDSDIRRTIGHSFTRMGLNHLEGIILLAREKAFAPCLALFRPMIEAHVRGLWLAFIASPDEVTKYVKNPAKFDFPHFRNMQKRIAETDVNLSETTLTPGEWKRLCDYTHGGLGLIEQVVLNETRTRRFAVEWMRSAKLQLHPVSPHISSSNDGEGKTLDNSFRLFCAST
jgi:hypothetical protein